MYVSALFFYSFAAVFFPSSHNHRRRRPTNPARPIFFYSTPRWFFHSPPPPPPLSPLLLLRRGRVVVACWAARDSTISILFCIVAQLSQQRRGAESGPFQGCLAKSAPKGRPLATGRRLEWSREKGGGSSERGDPPPHPHPPFPPPSCILEGREEEDQTADKSRKRSLPFPPLLCFREEKDESGGKSSSPFLYLPHFGHLSSVLPPPKKIPSPHFPFPLLFFLRKSPGDSFSFSERKASER